MMKTTHSPGRATTRHGIWLSMTLLAWTALPQSATAAAAASSGDATTPADSSGLEEIVVTAEKRESTVQSTPISISALTGGDLEAKGITTIEQLVGAVPGVSLRSAGPGQTEYEIRGLTSSGGAAATVGFYIDDTPLSASAVALNGRTVIDADLFDLNNVEVLRGPQGTLYGSGSLGGTIKLVTNQPKIGVFEGSTDVNTSQTSHGSTNGGGSLALNIPLSDIAALRVVLTEKYISGFIDRIVIKPGDFPYPTLPAGTPGAPTACVYYCNRGNVAAAPVQDDIKGSNLERYSSGRAALLLKPIDDLSILTTVLYQRIDADGYNNFQQNPGGLAIYQPYDQKEPYYDSFKLISNSINYDFEGATLTSATSFWQRYVVQSTDATEALENINNLTNFIPGSLYVEVDPTTQFSEELRLTSKGSGPWSWVGGLYFANLHSGYITYNQAPGYATAVSCGLYSAANPVAGHCPASEQFNPNSVLRYPNASLTPYASGQAANPNGIVFNDNNPDVLKQEAIFGESSYKFTDSWKLTAGLRIFHFLNQNEAHQEGLGTASANQDPTVLSQSLSGTEVLPKLNLSYTPTPDLTVYGTIARGSRPGGFNLPIPIPSRQQLAANPGQYNCGLPLTGPPAPVYVTSQPSYSPDTVLSFELGEKAKFADRRLSVNADVYYIQWTGIQQVLSLTCGYPYNTNAGNAKSYGPELEVSALVATGLTLNFSAAYTQAYISSPTAAAASSGLAPGTDIINVPKYTEVTSLDYHRSLTANLDGVVSVQSSLTGPVQDVAAYRQTLPSHNLVDGRLGVTSGPWAAYVTGTNLTNKVAELTIDNTTFAWQTYAITRVSTNQPRTVGVDFQYKF